MNIIKIITREIIRFGVTDVIRAFIITINCVLLTHNNIILWALSYNYVSYAEEFPLSSEYISSFPNFIYFMSCISPGHYCFEMEFFGDN